jgi:hypothetical protein
LDWQQLWQVPLQQYRPAVQSVTSSQLPPTPESPAAQEPLMQTREQQSLLAAQEPPTVVQQGPQSTDCPQLFSTGPHFWAQVISGEFGVQQPL